MSQTAIPPPPSRSPVAGVKAWVTPSKLLSVVMALAVIGAIFVIAEISEGPSVIRRRSVMPPQPSRLAPNPHQVNVSKLPVFSGHAGTNVVALVNKDGVVSAKVLGDRRPITCWVTAGNVVRWNHDHYVDTGRHAARPTTSTSVMTTFTGPVGSGTQSGWVLHPAMNLLRPYPKAIVVSVDCIYPTVPPVTTP